ncbi:MAG: PEP-CTERM sorting domain-containing protein [Armatimonadota bacterium]|nr:PEP-CTERM sorting domain-containing protein [Armatimonadota bacterium]
MIRGKGISALAVLIGVLFGSSAFGYNFWGITVGSEIYDGSAQLTFDGVTNAGVQYAVGGYKYTRVDSSWLGPFPAAAPGEGFLASRRSDAQGLFFKADSDAARFVIITGAAQYGLPAPEVGTGTRLFGPGDLMITTGGKTYGIGLRLSGLLWAVDPSTTNPDYQIWHGAQVDSIYARDAGTIGRVELNPRWDRAGHSTLDPNSELASAFFVSGSGTLVGSADVIFEPTGISLGGANVFAYHVSVPWSVLGLDPTNCTFTASWRPDCGNDILKAEFGVAPGVNGAVPEPSAAVGLLTGFGGLLAGWAKKRQ